MVTTITISNSSLIFKMVLNRVVTSLLQGSYHQRLTMFTFSILPLTILNRFSFNTICRCSLMVLIRGLLIRLQRKSFSTYRINFSGLLQRNQGFTSNSQAIITYRNKDKDYRRNYTYRGRRRLFRGHFTVLIRRYLSFAVRDYSLGLGQV